MVYSGIWILKVQSFRNTESPLSFVFLPGSHTMKTLGVTSCTAHHQVGRCHACIGPRKTERQWIYIWLLFSTNIYTTHPSSLNTFIGRGAFRPVGCQQSDVTSLLKDKSAGRWYMYVWCQGWVLMNCFYMMIYAWWSYIVVFATGVASSKVKLWSEESQI